MSQVPLPVSLTFPTIEIEGNEHVVLQQEPLPGVEVLRNVTFVRDDLIPHFRSREETHSLIEHLVKQIPFSYRTFGPGPRTGGILDHIRKEVREVAKEPYEVEEWIDLVLLALDGAWRAAHVHAPPNTDVKHLASVVATTMAAKLEVNINRDWPDWRVVGQDKAIEHSRSEENENG